MKGGVRKRGCEECRRLRGMREGWEGACCTHLSCILRGGQTLCRDSA